MIEVARAHDGHRLPQLVERADQASGDEPRAREARHQGEKDHRPEHASLRLDDALHLGEGSLDAELASLAIDLAVHRSQGRLQALQELVPRGEVCRLALPGVVEFEHVSRDGTDVPFDLAHAIRELRFFRRKARRPPFEPVAHHLLGERELLLGGGISAQVAPDHLGLVEHGVFHFRVRPRVGQALTERLERAALQRVTANRLDPDEQRGDHHEREPEQQLALEGHDGLAAPRARRGGTVPGISHMT